MIRAARGFTLVELMITVAIAGALVAMAVPAREIIVRRQNERDLRGALREIRSALDAHKRAVDEGRLPLVVGASGYPSSLEDLVRGIDNPASPGREKIYFLRRLPRDPFTRDESLAPAQTWGKRSYASAPDDPKEGADVYDVYSLSKEKGLNGLQYRDW